MKVLKTTLPQGHASPYLSTIADLLSDDPFLLRLFGSRFKVVAHHDDQRNRVNFSFRSIHDLEPDDDLAT
jgi:hypothetical protein